MISLLYLKHAYGESDESMCERWSENVVWQLFNGMAYSTPKLPCDLTQIVRLCRVLGEAGVEELLRPVQHGSIAIAPRVGLRLDFAERTKSQRRPLMRR